VQEQLNRRPPRRIEVFYPFLARIQPVGKALLSVPAHMSKFGIKDEMIGHYRRYERNELYDLMKNHGFKNINILCYGFPLLNITGKVIDLLFGLSRTLCSALLPVFA
jgi:hypothetical protein